MSLFHGIYSSSAPQNIGITVYDSSTHNRAFRYVVPQTSPWHHPTLPEIRPFSLNLHILIDDKQHLRYYILRPPPDKEPFDADHLPTISSVTNIHDPARLDSAAKAVIREVHNAFGMQRLWDSKNGLCYNLLTARFASDALHSTSALSSTTVSAMPHHSESLQTKPYVIRPATELPQVLASGDIYPLEYGSHSLDVPFNELQFKRVSTEIYGWYMYSWPWLANARAKKSVRVKAQKDCQILAQQCRWRNGGWLLDHQIQQFYSPRGLCFPASSVDSGEATNPADDDAVISANPQDYIEGRWIVDGLYKRARTALRRKYLMEFPWFELSSLKRKVEYDIGFLHVAWLVVGYPYMKSNDKENIHVETLQDKEIITFYNADMYDLVSCWPDESASMGKEGRLQKRMEKCRPHLETVDELW
ncbi:4b9e1b47-3e75-49ee-9177-54f6beac65ac-CDS [Sclerotinia trifoliorum]|uniref:4b9e1b47-3e75-49ee-9177-54f6beac65ac-CDS n=1 Tax=Sclerotinia trifoliorum TaxID=28548 RepID=A0A8H2VT56_9HELO|nr:4b9e1b47-3e75-49ee-9177-54f6beac65ac-CDS [Sclerotinia trifoliorum]